MTVSLKREQKERKGKERKGKEKKRKESYKKSSASYISRIRGRVVAPAYRF